MIKTKVLENTLVEKREEENKIKKFYHVETKPVLHCLSVEGTLKY